MGEEPQTPQIGNFSLGVHQSMLRGDELSTEQPDDEKDLETEGEEGHKLTADDTGTVEKGKLFFRPVHQQQEQSTPRVYNTQNR